MISLDGIDATVPPVNSAGHGDNPSSYGRPQASATLDGNTYSMGFSAGYNQARLEALNIMTSMSNSHNAEDGNFTSQLRSFINQSVVPTRAFSMAESWADTDIEEPDHGAGSEYFNSAFYMALDDDNDSNDVESDSGESMGFSQDPNEFAVSITDDSQQSSGSN